MNGKLLKIAQIAFAVASAGVTLASNYFDKKDRDATIAKEAAKAVADALKKEE